MTTTYVDGKPATAEEGNRAIDEACKRAHGTALAIAKRRLDDFCIEPDNPFVLDELHDAIKAVQQSWWTLKRRGLEN